MRVSFAQFDIVWEDRRGNYERARLFAKEALANGAQLLVLPEMFSTGFSMNPAVTAEKIDGETASFVRALAKEHKLAILAGLVLEGDGGKGRNSSLIVDKNGCDLAVYTKAHLFAYAGEHRYHQQGDGPVVFELDGMRCASYICYDLRFPELFRKTAETCHVVFVIASWPKPRQKHWDILLPARAVENQQYVVGVNRIGRGGELEYAGGSVVYDPQGNPIASAGDKEGLFLADMTLETVVDTRRSMPFLRDRRF
ncbi:MAG: carbon-nitrogen family hydrolase [Proteobacteria bacterium]|nr:carbon-nitrogen family hydrolase [Pseudomonadota bacterium]